MTSRKMIPFYLITGFLGSGKTTLLQEILNGVGSSKKVLVIQNEFAQNGIDGKTLRQINGDFELVEMNNGSVFCVCLLGNFVDTLLKVTAKYQPDVIFLESSGMADPINVAELLQDERLSNKIILQHVFTVVDAQNFEKGWKMMVRFKHQIMIADTVIVNKSDGLKAGLPKIEEKILTLSPFATCIFTSFCKNVFTQLDQYQNPNKAALKYKGISSGESPKDVHTSVVRSTKSISRKELEQFLNFAEPKCFRLKGFVNVTDEGVLAIQSTFGSTEIKPIENYIGPSELVAFSSTMNGTEFRKAFLNPTSV